MRAVRRGARLQDGKCQEALNCGESLAQSCGTKLVAMSKDHLGTAARWNFKLGGALDAPMFRTCQGPPGKHSVSGRPATTGWPRATAQTGVESWKLNVWAPCASRQDGFRRGKNQPLASA